MTNNINYEDWNSIMNSNPQSLANRVVAKYTLYAVGNSDIYTEIEAKTHEDNDTFAEIYSRALRHSEKDTYLDVKYRGNSDVLVEIQPIGFFDTPTEIEVRPHNRMWAMYEVQRPPLVNNVTNPIMDAYTRNDGVYATINNGSGTSMVVGKDESKVWDSYLKFDLSHVNPSLHITGSRLRLYYTGTFNNIDIEVREIIETWGEYSVTYLNSPQIRRLISQSYVYDYINKYIEIDVSDIVLEWINNPHQNFGFYIKASDDSINNQLIFRTRESFTPPELIVTHYDPTIYSNGRSDIVTEIKAMKAGESNKNTEITVDSTFSFSFVDTMIYCRQLDIPVHDDIDTEIEVTSPKLHAEITISIIGKNDVNAEVSVYSGIQVDSVDVEIIANTPFNLVEIFSSYLDDKHTEITVTHDKAYAEILVSTPIRVSEITVKSRYDADTEITVSKDKHDVEIRVVISDVSDIDTEIEINGNRKSDLNAQIIISRDREYVEIQSRVSRKFDVYTEITANQPFVYTEIRTPEQSNMNTEITVLSVSQKQTEITVSRDREHVEIYVRAYGENNVDSEIYVKYVSQVEVEIISRSVSQCEVEISVKLTSNVDAEITVSRNREYVEISPRVAGDDDVLAELEPRINMVDNIPVIITVGGRRGAYGFVM